MDDHPAELIKEGTGRYLNTVQVDETCAACVRVLQDWTSLVVLRESRDIIFADIGVRPAPRNFERAVVSMERLSRSDLVSFCLYAGE